MSKEIWKDIAGYENLYQVSNWGNVKSLQRFGSDGRVVNEKILKPSKSSNGYIKLELCDNSIRKTHSVHRLVASAFIGNPDNKSQVNHINGIKSDNRVENLEWMTRSENRKHAFEANLQSANGEKNSQAKLIKQQILEIREKYKSKQFSQKTLANQYGISQTAISQIINRKRWDHI